MQNINIWNQFDLRRKKIIFSILFVLLFMGAPIMAQVSPNINLPGSDQKKFKYGFSVGIFNSNYKMKYADVFAIPAYDSIHAINPRGSMGFSLRFIANLKLAQYLDLRVTPGASFYENKIQFFYTDVANAEKLTFVEATRIEAPILLKYKSARRGNTRMYFVGGVTPSIRVSGKKNEDELDDRILIKKENLSVEFGFGIDLYYPLFRFSPEIRFSRGLTNILRTGGKNGVNDGIKHLTLNSVTLYLQVGD